MQQPLDLEVGATFTTTPTRPIVVAVTATLVLLVLAVPYEWVLTLGGGRWLSMT